jgi:hypothetical protein
VESGFVKPIRRGVWITEWRRRKSKGETKKVGCKSEMFMGRRGCCHDILSGGALSERPTILAS